jgi:cytochrome c553
MKTTIDLLLAAVLCLVPIVTQATDMAERVKPCEACHGNQGRAGPDGYYPRLAGKPADYLYNQMQNFSHARRRYTLMRRMMDPLSATYQREMANYFANLQVPYLPPTVKTTAPTPEQVARGQQLALHGDPVANIPACNTCHGSNLMGNRANVPSLLGLPSAYLGAQLSAWTLDERATAAPDCMRDIAKRLSAADSAAVTTWLALQEVPLKANLSAPTQVAIDLRCGSAPELHGASK